MSVFSWQLVRRGTRRPFGSFNYIGLIVAHFEVVLSLRGYLGLHLNLVVGHVGRLLEAAPILGLIVKLVAT